MILAAMLLAASVAVQDERPEWCKPGYVCLRTQDAADLSAKLINLEAENQALRLTKRHIVGWAAVCGPSASVQVQNGKWDLAGTISCTIGPGIRW